MTSPQLGLLQARSDDRLTELAAAQLIARGVLSSAKDLGQKFASACLFSQARRCSTGSRSDESGDTTQAQFWTGLRPATPSNVPLIGATKLPNLFLNTGHGTLGWTHACGSGKSIARIVSGLAPEVDFAFT